MRAGCALRAWLTRAGPQFPTRWSANSEVGRALPPHSAHRAKFRPADLLRLYAPRYSARITCAPEGGKPWTLAVELSLALTRGRFQASHRSEDTFTVVKVRVARCAVSSEEHALYRSAWTPPNSALLGYSAVTARGALARGGGGLIQPRRSGDPLVARPSHDVGLPIEEYAANAQAFSTACHVLTQEVRCLGVCAGGAGSHTSCLCRKLGSGLLLTRPSPVDASQVEAFLFIGYTAARACMRACAAGCVPRLTCRRRSEPVRQPGAPAADRGARGPAGVVRSPL